MIGEGCNGGVGEFECAIIFGFFKKDYLSVAIIKASNDEYLMVDIYHRDKSSQFFIVQASSHRLDIIGNLLLLW